MKFYQVSRYNENPKLDTIEFTKVTASRGYTGKKGWSGGESWVGLRTEYDNWSPTPEEAIEFRREQLTTHVSTLSTTLSAAVHALQDFEVAVANGLEEKAAT